MKKWVAIPVLAGGLVIGGVAFAVSAEKGETISIDAVETKAIEAVGGQVKEVELDRELSGDEYEVEVESNGVEYDLNLDAVTGEVKKTEVDDRDDDRVKAAAVPTAQVATSTNDQDDDRDDRGENRSDDRDDDRDDDGDDKRVQASNTKLLTQDEAIAIAMKSAKGKVTEITLDEDDDRFVYEIEIRDGQMEYDFEIDAVTGAVLEFDKEREDD